MAKISTEQAGQIRREVFGAQIAGLSKGPDFAEFNTQLRDLAEKVDQAPLPPIEIAMWPQDSKLTHSLVNPEKFNDRFLEQPDGERGRVRWLRSLFAGLNIMGAVIIIIMGVDSGFDLYLLFVGLVYFAIFGSLFAMTILTAGKNKIRFNRQAQLVHVYYQGEFTLHIPWREVRPFLEMGYSPTHQLVLLFPRPRVLEALYLGLGLKPIRRPYEIGGAFDYYDNDSPYRALQRLEFLRRYMEKGIDAVQPNADGEHTPFAEEADDAATMGWFMKHIYKPLATAWYWFACGPLIDRWVQRKVDAFRWPEEVERLCAEGADLSGVDTTPVKARTDLFYRPDLKTGGVYFVDGYGNRVQMSAIHEG